MYFSWPGAQLVEREGNPPVHDILDRLGLLKLEHDSNVGLEIDSDDSESPSSAKETSTVESPQRLQHETNPLPNPSSRDVPALPQRVDSQQHVPHQISDSSLKIDSLVSQKMQSRTEPHQSLGLPAGFMLKPPARMTAVLPSTNPPDQRVEATDWSTIGCMSPWWQDGPKILQEPSYSDLDFTQAVLTAYTANDEVNPVTFVPYSQNPYLTDPGVYMCDYDV
jgi:hypothetical protein